MSNSEEEKREMRCASAGSLEDLQVEACEYLADENDLSDEEQSNQ